MGCLMTAHTQVGSATFDPAVAGVRIGSLCSGYGGLEMGLQAVVAGSVAWHVEYDKHPSAVLEARFPGVPNYGDITTADWSQVEPVDWLTAGYPCQPFSHAGKRKGKDDERHLWPFVAGAIGVLRPRRVLLENVRGHVSLGLADVLADLSGLGYDATWGVVRAADAGAPHNRARIFIVAGDAAGDDERHVGVADSGGCRGTQEPTGSTGSPAADTTECGWWGFEGVERGLGAAERIAAAVADASDGATNGQRPCPQPGPRSAAAANPGGGSLTGAAAARDGLSVAPECGTESAADADITVCETCGGRQRSGDARRLQPVVGGTAPVGDTASDARRQFDRELPVVAWGAYEPAIRRWEHVAGPAPRPTEPGRTGERLSPRFVEWLMGLPAGWVTDVLPRRPAIRALGNGVVPQQAALAVRTLLNVEAVAA